MAFGRTSSASVSVEPNVSVQGQRYAPDPGPNSRIDVNLGVRSESDLTDVPALPNDEFHFYSFYETSRLGDKSMDVDSSAARVRLGDMAHLWFGRVQPMNEGFAGLSVRSTDAVGANWAQNQSNALEPRVSGWVGLGVHARDPKTGLAATFAYSPMFLPSFGPRLDLSADSSPSGSRFSRLPPQYVLVQGNLLPIHYQLQVGNLRDIVFQNQAFLAVGHEGKDFDAHAMFWTAPDPNVQPQIDPSHPGQINGNEVDVMVTARPLFPRQHFWGFQATGTSLLLKPTLMGVYQAENRSFTLSAEVEPFSFLRAGYLTTLGGAGSGLSSGDVSGVVSPSYANGLVWFEASQSFLNETLTPSLRWEENLASGNRGLWLRPRVDYRMERRLTLFAYASLIAGEDYSYFGNWRTLGSVAMGASFTW